MSEAENPVAFFSLEEEESVFPCAVKIVFEPMGKEVPTHCVELDKKGTHTLIVDADTVGEVTITEGKAWTYVDIKPKEAQ